MLSNLQPWIALGQPQPCLPYVWIVRFAALFLGRSLEISICMLNKQKLSIRRPEANFFFGDPEALTHLVMEYILLYHAFY